MNEIVRVVRTDPQGTAVIVVTDHAISAPQVPDPAAQDSYVDTSGYLSRPGVVFNRHQPTIGCLCPEYSSGTAALVRSESPVRITGQLPKGRELTGIEHVAAFFYPTGLMEIQMSPVSGIGAFRTGQQRLEWFLEAVRRSVAWTIKHKAVFDFLAHPSCLGFVAPEFKTID